MGPEAEVPSAEASEEDSLSEALLSEEVLLVEALLSEAELSAAEELLPPLPPQPASIEAHRVSAKMVERTFFMVMTFLLSFWYVLFPCLTAYMINTECKVRERGIVKSM